MGVRCCIIIVLLFLLVTNEQLLCLSYSFSSSWHLSCCLPTFLLLLLPSPCWLVHRVDTVILLVIWIANIFSSLWQLLFLYDLFWWNPILNFLYTPIYQCSLLFAFLCFKKSLPILKSFFSKSFKVGLLTFKSAIH